MNSQNNELRSRSVGQILRGGYLTKLKGRVASVAPGTDPAAAVLFCLGLTAGVPSTAWAQCVTVGTDYTCAGSVSNLTLPSGTTSFTVEAGEVFTVTGNLPIPNSWGGETSVIDQSSGSVVNIAGTMELRNSWFGGAGTQFTVENGGVVNPGGGQWGQLLSFSDNSLFVLEDGATIGHTDPHSAVGGGLLLFYRDGSEANLRGDVLGGQINVYLGHNVYQRTNLQQFQLRNQTINATGATFLNAGGAFLSVGTSDSTYRIIDSDLMGTIDGAVQYLLPAQAQIRLMGLGALQQSNNNTLHLTDVRIYGMQRDGTVGRTVSSGIGTDSHQTQTVNDNVFTLDGDTWIYTRLAGIVVDGGTRNVFNIEGNTEIDSELKAAVVINHAASGLMTEGGFGGRASDITTVNISENARISSLTGIAILADVGVQRISLGGAAAVIGDVDLGSGDDSFTWSGTSSLIGDLRMGSGADTAIITSSGYDGSQRLSGGDSVGDLDQLSLQGQGDVALGGVASAYLTGWERIELDDVRLTLVAGSPLTASTGLGHGLFLSGGAAIIAPDLLDLVSDVDLAAGTLLRGAGISVSGELQSTGVLDTADGIAGQTILVGGSYSGGGGYILLDAMLTGDPALSTADRLVVAGDLIGSTPDRISVTNVHTGPVTGQESVLVVDVGGASTGSFVLDGRVASGSYEYFLNRHGNGNWYLESTGFGSGPIVRPEVGAYASNALAAAGMFEHSWRDRYGAKRMLDDNRALWFRLDGRKGSIENGRDQIDTDYSRVSLSFGADLYTSSTNGQDRLTFGIMGGVGRQSSTSISDLSGYTAQGSIEGYALGIYGTWQQDSSSGRGWYVDGWLTLGRYDAEVSSTGFRNQKYDISSATLSLEAGYSFDVAQTRAGTLWLEPQAQLIRSNVDGGSFLDPSQTRISLGGEDLTARLGLRAALTGNAGNTGFIQLDWLHSSGRPELLVGGERADFGTTDALRLSAGFEYAWSESGRLNLDIHYTGAEGDTSSFGARLGVNHRF